MRFALSFFLFIAALLPLQAANPAYTSFSGDQFGINAPGTAATLIYVKDGALFTNTVFFGHIWLPDLQPLVSPLITNSFTLHESTTAHAVATTLSAGGIWAVTSINTSDNFITFNDATRVLTLMGISLSGLSNFTGVGTINGFTVGPRGITNDSSIANGYVKTISTPTSTYNNALYSLQDFYDSTNANPYFSIAANPYDGTSQYGAVNVFGTAKHANGYGNLQGYNVWNMNIPGGVGVDRRAFVWRIKDPGGLAVWADQGAYALWETRYHPSAPDRDTSFANFLMCDQFGNVGLGDLGARSDDPALGMLHPWAKVTIHGSHSGTYGALGFFPYNPIATPVTNTWEWDGTNAYVTDKNLLRTRLATKDTNNVLLVTNLANGSIVTNLNAFLGNSKPAVNLVSANTSANMYWNEATLLMTNSSASGQIEWVLMVNDKGMGGLRMDQQGTFNWHATNYIFWQQTNSGGHIMTLKGGRVNIGGAASVTPTESLLVSGNQVITNGFLRFWVGAASPTASNFQAQVYVKTNAATAANELFAMNDAGNESILTGTVTNQFKGSATLDFGSTLANTNSDLTISVTGAADQDPVQVGPPVASVIGGTAYTAFVSSANTVTVRFNNYTTGAKDPASGTFKVLVTKLK